MEPSDHDVILLHVIPYFIECMGLLAEWKRWGCTIDQKMAAVQGSHLPTLLNLIYNLQLTLPFVGYKQFFVCCISTDFPMCHKCI
jgi:hypothetical protein